MRKVIKVLLCLLVFVMLIGCSVTYTDTNKNNNNNNNIGVIETYKTWPDYSYEVFYDKDTKVCYIAIGEGVTPLYNADGSLKTYNEEESDEINTTKNN